MPVKSLSRCEQTDANIRAFFGYDYNSTNTKIDEFNFLSERAALEHAKLTLKLNQHHTHTIITVSISTDEPNKDILDEYKAAETDYFETIKAAILPLSALETHRRMVILKAKAKKPLYVRCKTCGGKIPTDTLSRLDCPICGNKTFLATPSTKSKIQKYFDDLASINTTINSKVVVLGKIANKLIESSTATNQPITYTHHICK
ncbi:hypothetical protein [Photobacterium damselae]|uniref:hypothetical protein n=1 Tax=Photobacterium damselae TaxID=38293 RepID=UPI001F489DC6|nr:hypothetical protein [Photobacterium damselae]UKA04901.1 hypothetical protein IHC89_21900 [Photobacterium damselae subsp. damselae]